MATFGSLFAGIGGIDLGLERAGWDCRFQVEWDAFCQRVLAKHWPDVPRYGDIHEVHGPLAHAEGARAGVEAGEPPGSGRWTAEGGRASLRSDYRRSPDMGAGAGCDRCLPSVDLLAGGFPCQPFSVAGKQRRMDDDRWLWPEFARAIRELRPRFVLVENVPGLLVGGGMGAVLGDLAELGYDAEWESIAAAAVGAPHLRYRVWIVAYASVGGPRLNAVRPVEVAGSESENVAYAHGERGCSGPSWIEDAEDAGQPPGRSWGFDWWSVEPDVGRVAHGVPARVDRLRSLGNAVVPQVVEVIGRQLLASIERVA
jgi:DNA (cytosine-5)-methyltransferase 1